MTSEADNEVERLKALTLDLLAGHGEQSMHYVNIYWEHYECDGLVDQTALRQALNELVSEGKVARVGADKYRWMPPLEGESLADKVKRLEDHVVVLEKERDHDGALAVRLRRELKADRAATKALVEALPQTIGLIDPAAKFLSRMPWEAPLRALQARMATWPSEGALAQSDQRTHVTVEPAADVPGQWVARHVQRDIVTQGNSLPHALRMLAEAVEMVAGVEPASEPDAPAEDTFLGMTCVAQGSSGPATAPRDVVLVGRCAGRTASEHVATWPDYLHSDDVKRRREEFRKRCERLGISDGAGSRDTFSFVMPEDGIVRTSFNSETGEATAMHTSPRFDGERPVPVTCQRRRPNYVGEFGDIDEPSVGDVEGYGVRR